LILFYAYTKEIEFYIYIIFGAFLIPRIMPGFNALTSSGKHGYQDRDNGGGRERTTDQMDTWTIDGYMNKEEVGRTILIVN
jgi:hypothetical protein